MRQSYWTGALLCVCLLTLVSTFRLNFVLVFFLLPFPFPLAAQQSPPLRCPFSPSCLVCCRSSPSLRSSAPPSPRRAWPPTREPSEPCSTSQTTRQREVRPSAAHSLHGSPFAAPMQRVQGGVQILGQPARRVGDCAHGRTVAIDQSDGRPRSAVRPNGDGIDFARPLRHRAQPTCDESTARALMCAWRAPLLLVVVVADRRSGLQSSSSSFTLATSFWVWSAAASSSDTPAMCSLESPRMRQHTPSTMYEQNGGNEQRADATDCGAVRQGAMANFPRGVGFLQELFCWSIFLRAVCSPACVHLRRWWLLAIRVCVCARVLGSVQLLEAQPRGRRQLVARSPVPVLRVQLVQTQ